MPRANVASVAYPFLYALPHTNRRPVTAYFQEAPDGASYIWLTAADYLPENPEQYLQQETARTPRFTTAAKRALAYYVHDENGRTAAYATFVNLESRGTEPPPFTAAADFDRGAFSCCYLLPGRPDDLAAAWKRIASDLPEKAGFDLHLTLDGGTPEWLPHTSFVPEQSGVYTVCTPYGEIRVHPVVKTYVGYNLNAGGITSHLSLPHLSLVGDSGSNDHIRVYIEADFGTPLADYYWTQHTATPNCEEEIARALQEPVLKALANYVDSKNNPWHNLHLSHASWQTLNALEPEKVPLPRTFYCPWQPAGEATSHPLWKAPKPLPEGAAYKVRLQSTADQHLLALAWEANMPGVPLVCDTPAMNGYPWMERLPTIDAVTFTTGDDPKTVHKTEWQMDDDIAAFSTHPAIYVHAHVVFPDGTSAWLDLKGSVAFNGATNSYPSWKVFLADGNPPDPQALVGALVAGYFEAYEDAESESPQAQLRHYHLETLDAVYTSLHGADAAQQQLVQSLFDYHVFPYIDRRPSVITVNHPKVRIHFPPATD